MSQRSALANRRPPFGLQGLARQSLVFALGGLAYKAVALLSVPVFARLLTPSQLGLLDLAGVIASVLAVIAGLGTENALARRVAVDLHESVWSTTALVVGTGSVIAAIAGILLSTPLAVVLTGSDENGTVLIAASCYGASLALVTAALNMVRVRGHRPTFALLGFLIVLFEMLAALGAAILFNRAVALMLVGWTLASAVGILVVLLVERPPLRRPRLDTAEHLIRFGLPLVPAALAWIVGDLVVRAALAHGTGLASVGQFGIATRIVSVLALGVTGFGLAWHPYFYAADERDASDIARSAALRLTAVLGCAAILLSAAAPELVQFVAGDRYRAAGRIVPILGAGMVFYGLVTVAGAVAGRQYRTLFVAVGCVLGAVTQGVIATPAVALMGLSGAAVASTVGFAFSAVFLGASLSLRPAGGRAGVSALLGATVIAAGLITQAALGTEASVVLRLVAALAAVVTIAALVLVIGRHER